MRQLTILMAALLCLLVPLAALAEDAAPAERVDYSAIDLSGATLEELRELRDRIDRQIESMETVEDKRYESGTYAVGIDIPAVMSAYNAYKLNPGPMGMGGFFALEKKPTECVGCGACQQRCPQGIKIPELMAEIADLFKGMMPPKP